MPVEKELIWAQVGTQKIVQKILLFYGDYCVFMKKFSNDDFIILLFYVDDMLIISHDTTKIEKLKKDLSKSFIMKDFRLLSRFLV